ncbi:hypothetical protein EON83_08980 [bacterium]|nr:MAG: hypothetical protein EON83_08980 [bacterium]
MLRFDGIYCSPLIKDEALSYRDYFRFYEDGSVLAVVSTGTATEVARWFHKDTSQLSEGRYTLDGLSISFSTASPGGEIDRNEEFYDGSLQVIVSYNGQVGDNVLHLHSHSHFNGHEATIACEFVPIELLPPRSQ